jgi:hypothetical protein
MIGRNALSRIAVLAAVILLCLLTAPFASAQNFVPVSSLNTARQGHTATLLNNGMVLIAGGYGNSGVLSSAELYDPATGDSIPTGGLNVARELHTATLLNNGMVLIAGGYDGAYLASAELYDPAAGTFSLTGSLNIPRLYDTATLLNDGTVLIAGGGIAGNAELYNPATGVFTFTGSPTTYRYAHTATLLNNGMVLLAGGPSVPNAELYNPATGTFIPTGSLNSARQFHTATALNDGTVLITGGIEGGLSGTFLASAELYNPATGSFTPTSSLNTPRFWHTATLLNTGLVLVAGGGESPQQTTGTLASAELYDPTAGSFTPTGSLNVARLYHTATLLNNGTVLVAGGGGLCGCILASDELYEPVFNVQIEIRSSNTAARINLNSRGGVPVAILSTTTFDALGSVDTQTLTFGSGGTEKSLLSCDPNGVDVNGDGIPDLVCRFDAQASSFQLGDAAGTLEGRLKNGTNIKGTAAIIVVGH